MSSWGLAWVGGVEEAEPEVGEVAEGEGAWDGLVEVELEAVGGAGLVAGADGFGGVAMALVGGQRWRR